MSLLQMSLSAGAMILAVMAVRAIAMNRLPKAAFRALWGIVLARLLLPFSWPSPLGVASPLTRHPAAAYAGGLSAIAAPQSGPATHLIAPGPSPWVWAWGIGAALLALYFVIAYARCLRIFRASCPVENAFAAQWLAEHRLRRPVALRQADGIPAPLTYGILRPVILMPARTDWADTKTLQYVLAHEYQHIRSFDGAAKLLLCAALCLHWFNPLVWAMVLLANRDIELCCDEAVLRQFGRAARSDYARALLRMEEKKSGLAPLCSNFSKNAMEERIEAIMKIKKPSIAALAAAICLVAAVTIVFAASPAATGTTTVAVSDFGAPVSSPRTPTQQELIDRYGAYGVSFDSSGRMLFDGEPIRYFCDGVEFEAGLWSIGYEYLDEDGTVDVFSKREPIDNGDGSIDPFGVLTGLEKSSQAEFDQRETADFYGSLNAVTEAEGDAGTAGVTFEERFSRYEQYGLVYEERPGSSGAGKVTYNGKPVRLFVDESPDGSVFSYGSRDGGEIIVHAVYDAGGRLVGVKER